MGNPGHGIKLTQSIHPSHSRGSAGFYMSMACPEVFHCLVQDPQSPSVEILLHLLISSSPIAERVISDHALLSSHLRSRALGSAMSCSARGTRAEVQ